MFKMLDGNGAAVEAMKLAKISVIATYPITPQSPISENLAKMTASGELNAQYLRVESEHSAISATLAAQMTGVRAATATSSNGLALMHEVLSMVSGTRQPIVMPVVNRAVAAPWSLWCEHGDSMSQRDLGWIQLYCRSVQDVLDYMLLAYRVAEDSRVLLPVMVCLDGFFLSHSMQKILVPTQEQVDRFLGPYKPKNLYLNPADPMFICDLTGPEEYTEMKFQQHRAMAEAGQVISDALEEFRLVFGRSIDVNRGYFTDDADTVLVATGSMCGTAMYVVDLLRAEGVKAGLLTVNVFRPFPADSIVAKLGSAKKVAVFDRSSGLGSNGGPLWNEVCSALNGRSHAKIRSFIGGLGGRDVTPDTIVQIFRCFDQLPQWVDLRSDATEIREVVYVSDKP